MSSRRWLVPASVAAVATAWALLVRAPEKRPVATPMVPAAPVAKVDAPVPAPAQTSECVFAVGEHAAWSLEVTTAGTMSPLAAAGRVAGQVSTRARLEIEAISADVLLARLDEVTTDASRDVHGLTAPFLLKVGRRCEVEAYARLDTTSTASARLQQAVVMELAWARPDGSEISQGRDGVGPYVRRLTAGADEAGPYVHRAIERYTRTWSDVRERVPSDSHLLVRPGAGPWFESLAGATTLELPVGTVTTQVEARATRPSPDALVGAPRAQARYQWIDLLDQVVVAERRSSREETAKDREARAEASKQAISEAIASYEARVKAGVGVAQAWPPLAAWVEAKPEGAAQLREALEQGRVSEQATMTVYVALGQARNPEARDALLAIFRDAEAPVYERSRAIFNLVDRDDVDASLASELASHAQALESAPSKAGRFLARESLLALGMMADLQKDPVVTELAVRTIRSAITAGGDRPVALRPAFGALANLGDSELLSEVEPYSRHTDAKVREYATIAVRRMPPEKTLRFVLDWLRREQDPFVKRELYGVLERQHVDAKATPDPELVRQAARDLTGSRPTLIARKAMLRLVGRGGAGLSDVRPVLMAEARRALKARDGLFDTIAPMLTPVEIREVVP
jgi:hypothetical protein